MGKKYLHWVNDYWTTRGEPLDFKKHKYLVQIYKDQSPEIVFEKSAQAGLTERMITEAMWLPDNYKENSLYLFPTSGTASDLVQERVDEPINNNPYLAMISGRAKKIMGKQADKVNMKRMRYGFVYFRGANKSTQITSVSADLVLVDELDRMPIENVPYFDKRVEHSNRKWIRWGSTPTIPNFGIDNKFLESDRHYFYLKCKHCGEWQVLTFWDNIDKEKKMLVCKKCREHLVPWECQAEWRAENPESKIRGYHISQLYSPMLDVEKIIKDSKKTAEWEIQQFYNQNLGLPYEPKGAKLSEQDFQAATRDYHIPFKEENHVGFMGVDVGKVLHVVIMNKKRITYIGEKQNFEELDTLMKEFNVKAAVIDGLPETREAAKFEQRFKGRAYLCYYSGLKEIKAGEWYKKEPGKVNTDRTFSLDKSTSEIKEQNIEFPKNLDSVPDFKTHCKNLVRVIRQEKGNMVAEYIQVGPDHYRHAYNYSNIARELYSKAPILGVMSM